MANTYTIAPCIGVSNRVNKLKDYLIEVKITNGISLTKGKRKFLTLSPIPDKNYSTKWMGDVLQISFPKLKKKTLIGLQNKTLHLYLPFDLKPKKNPLQIVFLGISLKIHKDIKNFEKIFPVSKDWAENIPRAPKKEILSNEWEWMWNDIWIYHRFNQFLPEKAILRKWISPCRASPYQKDMVAMWDTLHIIEDLKYYDLESAIEMLKVHFDLFRESDGMCAQDYKISRDFAPKIFGRWLNEKTGCAGFNFDRSQPPMWSQTLIDILEYTKNLDERENERYYSKLKKLIKKQCLPKMIQNMSWWEEHRFFPNEKLFGYPKTSIDVAANESGLDNHPRFILKMDESGEWRSIPHTQKLNLMCVDLSAQMINYYENLGHLCKRFEIGNFLYYQTRAQETREAFVKVFWNDNEKSFFDFDLDANRSKLVNSFSQFWAYYALSKGSNKIEALNKRLTDSKQFDSNLPIPTMALNSPLFELDMWRGPVWISQDYWILKGLNLKNQKQLAKTIAKKILHRLTEIYAREGRIYEFYPPSSKDFESIKRKKSPDGPHPHYIGHSPIHAIYYEFIAS